MLSSFPVPLKASSKILTASRTVCKWVINNFDLSKFANAFAAPTEFLICEEKLVSKMGMLFEILWTTYLPTIKVMLRQNIQFFGTKGLAVRIYPLQKAIPDSFSSINVPRQHIIQLIAPIMQPRCYSATTANVNTDR
jgi:hypothetical protein